MNKYSTQFFQLVRYFLTCFLPEQKAASMHTVKSYRDTINVFLDYFKTVNRVPLHQMRFEYVTRKTIESFLTWLESEKHYSIASRNQRLSALKSFYKYASTIYATLTIYYQNILNIPNKIENKIHEIEFFSESALQSILSAPNINKRSGYRDFILMTVLYDTASRIQELLTVRIKDLTLEAKSPYIVFHGKGKKTRLVPLMDITVNYLKDFMKHYHEDAPDDDYLFFIIHDNIKTAMSSDNAEKFIQRYGLIARDLNNEVPKHVYPHMFRHSRAMLLYRKGMLLPLLSEFLGNSRMETTIAYYANADVTMKRDAISKATKGFDVISNKSDLSEWEDD